MFVLKLLPAICLLGFFQRTTAPPTPSASSAKPQVAEPSYFRISGRVIDADSGQPLARAFVEINLSNSLGPPNAQDSAHVEVTGTDGTFVFTSTRLLQPRSWLDRGSNRRISSLGCPQPRPYPVMSPTRRGIRSAMQGSCSFAKLLREESVERF